MSDHTQHRMHENSLDAYRGERRRFGRRAQTIRDWFAAHGAGTDRDVMRGLGFSEMNAVRPRCTELVDLGVLVEVGSRVCRETGKRVRVLDLSMAEKMR